MWTANCEVGDISKILSMLWKTQLLLLGSPYITINVTYTLNNNHTNNDVIIIIIILVIYFRI